MSAAPKDNHHPAAGRGQAEDSRPNSQNVRLVVGATPKDTAGRLLAAGFWPIPLFPHPYKDGKQPIGEAWGLNKNTLDTLRAAFKQHPGAGIGIGLGPGRGPGGRWLIDIEGDGPEAEDSRLRLFRGEVVDTFGWSSAKGGHRLHTADHDRMVRLLKGLKGCEEKGRPGVYHLKEFPGLELRNGGLKRDGTVKQFQSVFPPTPGTDGKPREWNGVLEIAPVPESFYEALERAAAAKDGKAASDKPASDKPRPARSIWEMIARSTQEEWFLAGLREQCATVASTPETKRRNRLRDAAYTLGGQLHHGYLNETEVAAALKEAGLRSGLPEWEVERTIEDGITDGKGAPLPWPDGLERPGEGGGDTHAPSLKIYPVSGDDAAAEIEDHFPKIDYRAFHGVVGDFVRAADPQTEADPVAILVQMLVSFGNIVGRNPYFAVSATRHHTNLYTALAGLTATGRKGSSWDVVKFAFKGIDDVWARRRVKSGLVSGEGLIHNVRDESYKTEPTKDKGKVTGYQRVLADEGVADKRLLVIETEMGRVLKAMNRETNTLSDVIRQFWDGGDHSIMSKNSENVATGAHVSLVCHVTPADVQRHLLAEDANNGFANRFLWIAVRQSKMLPDGGDFEDPEFQRQWHPIRDRLANAVTFARAQERVRRDRDANKIWAGTYEKLCRTRGGGLDPFISRAAPYVLRLATIYALLDESPEIKPEHLAAAVALWDYAEASARFLFGSRLGSQDSEKLLNALREAPEGLTRTEIATQVFCYHKKSKDVTALLSELLTRGEIHKTTAPNPSGTGRPAERWRAGRAQTPPAWTAK
jgi:hypothetical protein